MEQIAAALAAEIASGTIAPGAPLPAIRAVAAREGRSARLVHRAYRELERAGLIVARDRARARVAPGAAARARRLLAGAAPDAPGPLRLAGSDDPALDALLAGVGDGVAVVPGPRGSVHGLEHLARGTADAAVAHLRHHASGRYNDPFLGRLVPGERLVVVHLWRRELGLVVPHGNPHGIRGPRDLAGRRLAWRRAGTGSRLALERLLHAHRVEPAPGRAWAGSHRAVAAGVAAGAADAGLAVRAAAEAASAGFVALEVEPFELVIRPGALAAAAALLDALADPALRARVDVLGGYDLAHAGRERLAA